MTAAGPGWYSRRYVTVPVAVSNGKTNTDAQAGRAAAAADAALAAPAAAAAAAVPPSNAGGTVTSPSLSAPPLSGAAAAGAAPPPWPLAASAGAWPTMSNETRRPDGYRTRRSVTVW